MVVAIKHERNIAYILIGNILKNGEYMCGKNTIKAVISYKDLVVLMSNRFNFRKHAL